MSFRETALFRRGGPLLGLALLTTLLALGGSFWTEDRLSTAAQAQDAHETARAAEAQAAERAAEEPRDAGVDASFRYDNRGRLIAGPGHGNYRCLQPDLEIPRSEGCANGGTYPECRWQLPEPVGDNAAHAIWRNTTDDHRWGRPALVSLILAVAHEYAARWPGEHLTVGDLDAPGPRHQTHDRGVDVDLYLEDDMMFRNEGRGRYVDNYEDESRRRVRLMREKNQDLARIIATCAGGQIRIYYNDFGVIIPFRRWFEEQGMHSDVGRPMRAHNPLHRFHFHLTVPEDLPVQPGAD